MDTTHRHPLTVACVYEDGSLSSDWFRMYRRLQRMVERAELAVRVELTPAHEVPQGTDIVLVRAGLERTLPVTAPAAEVISVPERPGSALQDVLRKLERASLDTAAPSASTGTNRAVHRGYRRVL